MIYLRRLKRDVQTVRTGKDMGTDEGIEIIWDMQIQVRVLLLL